MRREILVSSSFSSVDFWVFASSCKSASGSNFLYSEISVNVHFEAVLQLFPEAISTPLTSLVPSRVPDLLSPCFNHFRGASYNFIVNRLPLLLHRPLAFQRNFGCFALRLRVFRTILDLLFSQRLLWRCNLLTQDCGWWSQMTLFARFAIPNLVLLTILPTKRHRDAVSNDCDNALSEELRNHHGVLLHLDFHRKEFRVAKKTACRALSLSFPPGISPLPR